MRALQQDFNLLWGAGGTRSSVVQSILKLSTQPRISFVRKVISQRNKAQVPNKAISSCRKGVPQPNTRLASTLGQEASILMQVETVSHPPGESLTSQSETKLVNK